MSRGAIIALALVLVGVVLLAVSLALPQAEEQGNITRETLVMLDERGTVLGNPDAPVWVYKWDDVLCPFCAYLWYSLGDYFKELVSQGKIKLVILSLPVHYTVGDDYLYAQYSMHCMDEEKLLDFLDDVFIPLAVKAFGLERRPIPHMELYERGDIEEASFARYVASLYVDRCDVEYDVQGDFEIARRLFGERVGTPALIIYDTRTDRYVAVIGARIDVIRSAIDEFLGGAQ